MSSGSIFGFSSLAGLALSCVTIVAAMFVACGTAEDDGTLGCGPGTHVEGELCVPDQAMPVDPCASCNPNESCIEGQCVPEAVTPPAQQCEGECAVGRYDACTCGADDPWWDGDAHCDAACATFKTISVEEATDCSPPTLSASLGSSCEENDACTAGLTCVGGECVCCGSPYYDSSDGEWRCPFTVAPADARERCIVERDPAVDETFGVAAINALGKSCRGAEPDLPVLAFCPPELTCNVAFDGPECGCCAEVLGVFTCSTRPDFARTFCLGLDRGCLDAGCGR